MDVYSEFKWRGLIYDKTKGIRETFSKGKVTTYIGFDPSAPSLHVGSLIPIMGLVHLQRHGHTPIAVVGGGTGLIGDPSEKEQERPLLTKEEIQTNLQGIKEQLSRFLDFDTKGNPAMILNNVDWLVSLNLTDFLRDIGKHFSIGSMISKESTKRRMEEEGISFTEFSYLLLQAYDFLYLYEKYNCTVQMGASDQWGNITAGIDLIRRIHGAKSFGLVFPLLTTASGTKYGKTESGPVWLDAKLTSPYKFYQFWLNTDDKDVVGYLKLFTLLTEREIQELTESVVLHPDKREAQKKLAGEVTRLVHGDLALSGAEQASRVLFGEEIGNLRLNDILDIFDEAPSIRFDKTCFSGDGVALVDLVTLVRLAQSKSEARRLVQGGGIYLQNVRVTDSKRTISLQDAIDGQVLILRKGQKEYRIVHIS